MPARTFELENHVRHGTLPEKIWSVFLLLDGLPIIWVPYSVSLARRPSGQTLLRNWNEKSLILGELLFLGLTAPQQSGDNLAASVIPQIELLRSFGKFLLVH